MNFGGYKHSGFTLMEIAISVLIVAIITLVTVPVIRGQLKRSDEYSYYLAFRTVEKLGGQIAALGDPDYAKTTKIPSKIDLALLPAAKFQKKYAKQTKFHPLIAKLSKNLADAELKMFKVLFPKAYAINNPPQTYDMFTSDDIESLYYMIKVCIDGEKIEKSNDGNGNVTYYTKADLGCTNSDGSYITAQDDDGNQYTATPEDVVKRTAAKLFSNSDTCFNFDTVCSSGPDDCKSKRDAATSSVISYVRTNGADAANTTVNLCNGVIKNNCKAYGGNMTVAISAGTQTKSAGTSYEDEGSESETEYTTGYCDLKVTTSYTEPATSGGETWYPEAAPSCESLGYINTENKAEANATAWVTPQTHGNKYLAVNQKIYNDCQCKSGYSWSENNSKVCCENSSGLSYYIGDGKCTSCQTDFNPQKKSCCLNYSTYNSSTGKCECIMGYSGDGDDSNTGCTRSSCPPGMLLDEDAKVCVPAPPLISAKRFCELIVANWNLSSYSCSTFNGSPSKYESVYNAAYKENVLNSIKSTSGSFNSIAPNIVFSNGLKLWILGDRAASIPGLSYDSSKAASTQNMCIDLKKSTAAACSDAGGYFCSSEYHCMKLDGTSTLSDARNCCSSAIAVEEDYDAKNMALSGFTVYVDINGSKGNGTLWEDVFPFYVTTAGRVYPAYPLDGAEAHVGGNNPAYLSADVYYYKASSNSRKRVLAFSEISYADAVCKAGVINPKSPYCLNLGSVATGDNPCTRIGADDATTKCFVSIRKKAKFL